MEPSPGTMNNIPTSAEEAWDLERRAFKGRRHPGGWRNVTEIADQVCDALSLPPVRMIIDRRLTGDTGGMHDPRTKKMPTIRLAPRWTNARVLCHELAHHVQWKSEGGWDWGVSQLDYHQEDFWTAYLLVLRTAGFQIQASRMAEELGL